jgi:hypothetical protein
VDFDFFGNFFGSFVSSKHYRGKMKSLVKDIVGY